MSLVIISVQEAATVHGTIRADTQTNANDQERVYHFTVLADAGPGNLMEGVLIPDNNVVLVGRIEAVEMTETDGPTDGSPRLFFECVNSDNIIVQVGATLTAPNEKVSAALSPTCESILFQVEDGADAGDMVEARVTLHRQLA